MASYLRGLLLKIRKPAAFGKDNSTHADLQHLQRSLFNVYSAVDQSSIISKTDKSGNIIFVNSNFERISGYTRDELLGQPHSIINSNVHPRHFWADVWKTISTGKIWRGEVCNRAKNGKLYWVDTFIYPFYGADGKLVEYFSIRNDITERKAQEEAITKSATLLRSILNSTSDIFVLLDKEKRILSANAHAENFLKGRKSLDSSILDFFNLQKDLNGFFDRALCGESVHEECLLTMLDGTRSWYKVRFNPAYKNAGQILGVSINLTNIQVKKSQELALLRQNRALTEIAWVQSHEIRRPVASILGLVSLLSMKNEEEQTREIIEHLKVMACELDEKIGSIVRLANESEVKV